MNKLLTIAAIVLFASNVNAQQRQLIYQKSTMSHEVQKELEDKQIHATKLDLVKHRIARDLAVEDPNKIDLVSLMDWLKLKDARFDMTVEDNLIVCEDDKQCKFTWKLNSKYITEQSPELIAYLYELSKTKTNKSKPRLVKP